MSDRFLDNFRSSQKKWGIGLKNNIEDRAQTQRQENFSRLNRDIAAGKIEGTPQHSEKEYHTLVKMDKIYRLLANEFQDRFYEKHYDKEKKGWEDVPDEKIIEESNDFLNEVINDRGLGEEKFDNGKTFIENFRKYNYNRRLLPDIDRKSDYTPGSKKYIFEARPNYLPKTPSEKERLV